MLALATLFGSMFSMGNDSEFTRLDQFFYLTPDEFFQLHRGIALTYDDVSLATLYSEVLPGQTSLETELAPGVKLNLPILSADMDTVTESKMAIAMALNGGLGVIHYNMPERRQLAEVSRVKNHIHGLIQEPVTVQPEQTVGEVLKIINDNRYSFSTFPVVDRSGKLVGLLPGQVVKHRYAARKVAEVMTPRAMVHTVRQDQLGEDPIMFADRFFNEHPGIHKLLVVDEDDRLRGLFTLSDIERITQERNSQLRPARDSRFRLLCAAAVNIYRTSDGEIDRDRLLRHVGALVERSVDLVAVSTAHGFSKGVGETVKAIREAFPELPIMAGNVTSAEGVEYLARCGANVIKIGQGPGSICTTRLVAGVGIPQLTALYVASRAAIKLGVTIVADGGITKSGDIVKALTMAHAVMCGGLLAGCPEAPGEILEINGKLYKRYRGMGSLSAMKEGSAIRYGHLKKDLQKVAPEGIEALKEASPSVDHVLSQLAGGIQAGLGYLGARNLGELRQKARFVMVTSAGRREAGPHDVIEVKMS